MASELTALAQLILSEVKAIETTCKDTPLPPLDQASLPEILTDPKFTKSANIVIAAASRLIAAVQDPIGAMFDIFGGSVASTTINIAVETNITELLKEAGPEGMHIHDIGEKVNVEPTRLGRCLRYLCARHVFREVSPDVFANNRMSMAFDTGKSFEQTKDHGPHRYDNQTGIAALAGHGTDECLKGLSVLSDIIRNPKERNLGPSKAPVVQRAGFDGPFFEWLEQPGNEKRLHRFGSAMTTFTRMFPVELILTSFDWSSLPKNSLVVDVGGGVGAVTLPLARTFRDLRYIIQDRSSVIADAKKFWDTEYPEAINTGRVQFQGHDFFAPQPVKDASVFFLRYILHNWPDAEAKIIIEQLRSSATPNTKLILYEHIVPFTCPPSPQKPNLNTVPGSEEEPLPEVLRGNPGISAGALFMLDIMMMNLFDSPERTMSQWVELLQSAGWKIESIQRGAMCAIVCTPI